MVRSRPLHDNGPLHVHPRYPSRTHNRLYALNVLRQQQRGRYNAGYRVRSQRRGDRGCEVLAGALWAVYGMFDAEGEGE